jgi:hypothetical protein
MDKSMQAALTLLAVSVASLERDVDRPMVAFAIEGISDHAPEATSIDNTLTYLLSHKLLTTNRSLYVVTDLGGTILTHCSAAASSQREWLENIAATLSTTYAGL